MPHPNWPPPVTQLLRGGPAADVVFDMDGTLIDGDLGNAVFKSLLDQGHLPALIRETYGDDPWLPYLAAEGVAPDEETYTHCGQICAGCTPQRVAQAGLDVLASGAISPRASIVHLAQALRSSGHRVWVLSGTVAPIVGAVAGLLGLEPARALGMRLHLDAAGLLTDRVDGPVHCGPGKLVTVDARIGRPIAFAIGDSMGDWDLLNRAACGVLVCPAEGPLAVRARRAGIHVRLPPDLA